MLEPVAASGLTSLSVYARVSGEAGILTVHQGPGLTNAHRWPADREAGGGPGGARARSDDSRFSARTEGASPGTSPVSARGQANRGHKKALSGLIRRTSN